MNRRDLLHWLLALPLVPVLPGPKPQAEDRDHHPRPVPGRLRVVVDGAFAIVVQADSRSRVRVFTPREPAGRHELYFLDQPKQRRSTGALEPRSKDRSYHFELLPSGIKSSSKPEIDAGLADFNVSTDQWCQEDYFVTIDLPCPRRITFMPPERQVTFKNGGRKGCVPYNHILDYEVTDLGKVKMAWQDVKEFHPVPGIDLMERYKAGCKELGESERYRPPCADEKVYKSMFGEPNEAFFFFGVGLPGGDRDEEHPIRFFNESLLASFPRLKEKLAIASIDLHSQCKTQAGNSRGELHAAALTQRAPQPRVLEVSSIVDCKVSGPLVTFPC
jgi:hypothetical protein